MVALDSTILSILLFPDAELHEGGKAVEHTRERVDGLVRELESAKEQQRRLYASCWSQRASMPRTC
jgi:hypothetical protein